MERLVKPWSWFEVTAQKNFEEILLPEQPRQCLQLGCFTGDASVWLMKNTACELVDVDTFKGSDEHPDIDFDQVAADYVEVTEPFSDRVHLWVGSTEDFLTRAGDGYGRGFFDQFDFIYVDADHHAKEVLRDAVMAWPLLKSGGIMAFDDYVWGGQMPRRDTPKPAIDAFVDIYQPEVLLENSQLWVRKG